MSVPCAEVGSVFGVRRRSIEYRILHMLMFEKNMWGGTLGPSNLCTLCVVLRTLFLIIVRLVLRVIMRSILYRDLALRARRLSVAPPSMEPGTIRLLFRWPCMAAVC